MSQGSRKKQGAHKPKQAPPAQPVGSEVASGYDDDEEYVDDYSDDYEDDYSDDFVEAASPRRQQRAPGRQTAPPEYRGYRPRSVQPPRRDLFPYVMGAVIGALLVGLMSIVYLLGAGSKGSVSTVPDAVQPVTGGSGAQPTVAPATDAPRIPMGEFKALYDDPAKRPIIIDVRAKSAYDQGHIKGAISFPEADVDARVAELPKDKLVIAYCQ